MSDQSNRLKLIMDPIFKIFFKLLVETNGLDIVFACILLQHKSAGEKLKCKKDRDALQKMRKTISERMLQAAR